MSNGKGPNPRRMALDALIKMKMPAMRGEADGYSNIICDAAIKRAGASFSEADKGLFTRLVAGVCERRITIDYIISRLSSRSVEKLDADVLNVLRLGVWQLRYADRIPEHAAVNETVDLAGKYVKGFVNGILRSYLREKDALALPEGDTPGALAVRYSVGKPAVSALVSAFGTEKTKSVLEASFYEPKMTLRVNTLRNSREELEKELEAEGFSTERTEKSPYGLRIVSGSGLPAAITDGLCFVQDEASQLCALALDARPGMKTLDVCSCPGSKSFSAALTMENSGEILACDLHGSKLPLVEKAAARLGISIIRTLERDSSKKDPAFRETFDRVICDVPCSGLGVMAKKPEIRYKSMNEAKELPPLQYGILCAAADALRPGGTLVYSTCTILPDENENNVRRFLGEHPDFCLSGFGNGAFGAPDGMLTLMPDRDTDGFFIAKLVKND